MKNEFLTATLAVLLTAAITSPTLSGYQDDTGEGHGHRTPSEEVHWLEQQVVRVGDFEAEGHILAIGGGGEGIIGQLKGRQVIAIDISRRELEDAPGDALKIVMDARELQFVDGSFSTAASFFTLMYIDGADHPAVFAEVYRVLRPGGRFLVWDARIGPVPDRTKEMVVVPLTVKLPDREVSTGYGVSVPARLQDLDYYLRLGLNAGFEVVSARTQDQWFHLELRKPE